jgi:hypothetical protein
MRGFWDALLSFRLLSKMMTETMLGVHAQNEDGDRYGLGIWIGGSDPGICYLQGADPGVEFYSFYNRSNGRHFTVLSNRPEMDDAVFRRLIHGLK